MSAIVRLMYDNCSELPNTSSLTSLLCSYIQYVLYLPTRGPHEAEPWLGLEGSGQAPVTFDLCRTSVLYMHDHTWGACPATLSLLPRKMEKHKNAMHSRDLICPVLTFADVCADTINLV